VLFRLELFKAAIHPLFCTREYIVEENQETNSNQNHNRAHSDGDSPVIQLRFLRMFLDVGHQSCRTKVLAGDPYADASNPKEGHEG
jgi:hypothetical protein